MAEEQPEKGTRENPLTREDVIQAIKENGGTADKLDLSGKWFEEGINLSGLDLKGIILKNAIFPTNLKSTRIQVANLTGTHFEKANLAGAHLEGADLKCTHLEGASLWDAHLEGATLWDTSLKDANLVRTHLEGADLIRTIFSSDVNLEDVDWGNYILKEEKQGLFDSAVASYRHLKVWYTNAGYSDIAAIFYYREKEAGRKSLRWGWNFKVRHRLALEFLRILFGYGEKWRRIGYWITAVVLGCALTFYCLGGVAPFNGTAEAFLSSLYFSTVSFTALGYGPWFGPTDVRSWAQAVGAAESFLGVLMMAALLVTFVRKWTR